jgi:hypothetical protein
MPVTYIRVDHFNGGGSVYSVVFAGDPKTVDVAAMEARRAKLCAART